MKQKNGSKFAKVFIITVLFICHYKQWIVADKFEFIFDFVIDFVCKAHHYFHGAQSNVVSDRIVFVTVIYGQYFTDKICTDIVCTAQNVYIIV